MKKTAAVQETWASSSSKTLFRGGAMRMLLAVEDSPFKALATLLRGAGYAVDLSTGHDDSDYFLATGAYDLLIFEDGLLSPPERLWAAASPSCLPPIMVISAAANEGRRIACLDAGADDCLTMPFGTQELLARLRMLLRRQHLPARAELHCGPLEVNRNQHTVACNGQPIHLTQKEFSILEYLALQGGRAVGRGELVSHVWDDNHDPASRVLDVHVSNLRAKLGSAGTLIRGVRGEGYLWAVECDACGV